MIMIKLAKRLFFISAVIAVGIFVACSDDDNSSKTILTPIFSEPLKLRCEKDVTTDIEFTSDIDWKLSSGAIWCTLSADGNTFSYDISGKAGKQKIFVSVNDDAQDFEETSTNIVLTRNGQDEIIAIVYRVPEGYALEIIGSDGEKKEAISIASNGVISFDVDANFDFGVSEYPEWVGEFTVTYNGNVPNRKNFLIRVREEYEPFPCSGSIVFVADDNDIVFPYEITYSGMSPESIVISGENVWGWSLSSDGTVFSCSGAMSGNDIIYNGSVPYNVKTFNYDCKFICFEESDNALTLMENEDSWIKVTTDATDASKAFVSAVPFPAETEGSRKAYVYAVPAAMYDGFMDLYAKESSAAFIDSTYNNVMMEVTQVSDYVDLTTGFYITDTNSAEIECFEESDEAIISMLNEKYSIDEIFAVSVDAGTYITAYPHLTDTRWEGYKPENTIVTDAAGNVIEDPRAAADFEIGMNQNDEYYMSLTAGIETLIIILKGVNGDYLKALVVKSGIVLNPGTGFDVKYMMTTDIPCTLETDMDIAASIIEKYGVNEIYSITYGIGKKIFIFPHLTEEEWIADAFESYIITDIDGNTVEFADINFECGEDPNTVGMYYASLIVKSRILIVVFVGADGENKKAIVIKPQDV